MINEITTYPTKGFNPPIPGHEFTARMREGNGSRAAYGATAEQAKANLERNEADRRENKIRGNDGSTSIIDADGIIWDVNKLLANEREFRPSLSAFIDDAPNPLLAACGVFIIMLCVIAILGGL